MAIAKQTLSQVIGSNARRIRTEAGATQRQVAAEMVQLGLPWSSGRVAQCEAGDAAPTIPTLVLLAAALDNLTPARRAVTPVDLLASHEPIGLIPGVSVPGSVLVGILRGGGGSALTPYRRPYAVAGESAAELETRDTYGRTEERVAKELGVGKAMMVKSSALLWGHNLSVERDRRAAELGSPVSRVAKSRITAALREELAALLEHAGDEG